MEKVYFINFKRYGVILYGSYEEAENDLFDCIETGLIRLNDDIQARVVVADALEINYPKEECKTDSALLLNENEFDEEENWIDYLESAANKHIVSLRKDKEKTFNNVRVFELYNVKKFKPARFLISDEE